MSEEGLKLFNREPTTKEEALLTLYQVQATIDVYEDKIKDIKHPIARGMFYTAFKSIRWLSNWVRKELQKSMEIV